MEEREQAPQQQACAPRDAPQDREEPVRVMPSPTAARTTGERPGGVGAVIQREIDEGGGNVVEEPTVSPEKVTPGASGPRPRNNCPITIFPGGHEGTVPLRVGVRGEGCAGDQYLPLLV